jgi:hypothetical protein
VDDFGVITQQLIFAGGDTRGGDLQQSVVGQHISATAVSTGVQIDARQAERELASDPAALQLAIGATKAARPEAFIDITRFERLSGTTRLLQIHKAILRGERRQSREGFTPLGAGASGRRL